jgi:hypothetical protein
MTPKKPDGGAAMARVSASAAKQRRYRARRRAGAVVLRGVALPYEVVAALIESGRLDEKSALDRGQVGKAAIAVLSEWAKNW